MDAVAISLLFLPTTTDVLDIVQFLMLQRVLAKTVCPCHVSAFVHLCTCHKIKEYSPYFRYLLARTYTTLMAVSHILVLTVSTGHVEDLVNKTVNQTRICFQCARQV